MGQTKATSVFSGQAAAAAFAAFNLRDRYYRQMAGLVINASRARHAWVAPRVIDVGARVGITTMEVLSTSNFGHSGRIIAVEAEEEMRRYCAINTMGDPRVEVVEGNGGNLRKAIGNHFFADAVLICQGLHLYHPSRENTSVPTVLQQVSMSLCRSGVVTFDLGPSNYEFDLPLTDHRRGIMSTSGEIMTELNHPLYQRAQAILLDIVLREIPGFDQKNLWPPLAARMDFDFLTEACKQAGLNELQVSEELVPISGQRVVNFIRNGWAVFFRWPPLSDSPTEQKLALMKEALNRLFKASDFEAMSTMVSYHPSAVFTAVKA